MTKNQVLKALILPGLLVGLTGCSGPEGELGGADGPQAPEVSPAVIEAGLGFRIAEPDGLDGVAARSAATNVPTSGSFELIFSDPEDPSRVIHVERVDNAPFGSGELRVPADIQGQFRLSAWIYGDDGSVFATPDLITGPDGEPLYPDAPPIYIDLRFGSVTGLTFLFYQQLRWDEGDVELSTDVDIALQLTQEQQEEVRRLEDPRVIGKLSDCLAYDMTVTQSLIQTDEGTWLWTEQEGAVLLSGHTCHYEVEISEDGAPRLKGALEFEAPSSSESAVELGLELEVIDAYVDVGFSVMGSFADVKLDLDETLQLFLDESEWDEPLRYVLTADNGYDTPVVTELGRDGEAIFGTLSPIDQYSPHYLLTLEILEGDVPVITGWGSAELRGGADVSLKMSYDLDLIVTAKNLTNVQFNAWLEDAPEVTEGIRVQVEFQTPEGFTLREHCVTGDQADYSCTIQVPTYSGGYFKVSHPGYEPVYGDMYVDTLTTISTSYIALKPGEDVDGSAGGSADGVTEGSSSEDGVHPASDEDDDDDDDDDDDEDDDDDDDDDDDRQSSKDRTLRSL